MISAVKETIGNENGFILILALLMLVMITLIGVAATRTADIELQIAANERDIIVDFNTTEGSLIETVESFETYLTSSFLSDGESASTQTDNIDFNGDGTDDASIEIRPITSSSTYPWPAQSHIGPPPAGSGFSLKYFEVRRYGVQAESATGNTKMHTGIYKVFNKF